ncbi:hypothetical protein [Actinoplanes sp. HUAS TT8]
MSRGRRHSCPAEMDLARSPDPHLTFGPAREGLLVGGLEEVPVRW